MHPHAVVEASAWHDVALFLRDDPRLRFDWLRCVTGVDHLEDKLLTAIYELHAVSRPPDADGLWTIGGEIAIKVRVPRDNPHIPSVADIWPAANWHEREAFDLLGIIFDGHPDPRRILCPDDWEGHPLRKDYEFPLEYHGIPAVTEYGMSRPQH
jgi:NADH-quinone oxidoreductase subunit C